jgi:hypothetical protein
MRKETGLAVFAVALMVTASPTRAQDVAGTWVLSVELSAGSGEATFVFRQEGETLSGTYAGALGDNITVTGKVASGRVEFSFDSQAGRVTYVGTVEGDRMQGTCEYGQLGSGTFAGRRRPPPAPDRNRPVRASAANRTLANDGSGCRFASRRCYPPLISPLT